MKTHQKDIGEAALSGLQSIPRVPIEAVLTSLINEIDSIQERLILVLDDYHLIDSASIHEAVDFLIEHQPAQMCLVVATRTDPPLPLHRLRARGQMTEMRVDELRFNREETRHMLDGLLETTLAADDVTILDGRVEGWAAGLQMVAISMQYKEDVHEFVQSFSGSHRYIMDYLTEEIFDQQPAHIQEFLLKTSVMDRLSGSLCDYLLEAELHVGDEQDESPPAQQVLEYLEQSNLFLLPMDQERCWYRYHNLFASLLRQRMRQTWPEEVPGLMRRAATWFVGAGYIDEAFTYALATNDADFAADLIQSQSLDLLKNGALTPLLRGLKQLPEEIILERPWLNVYLSWALLLTGELGEIKRYLEAAEDGEEALAEVNVFRGHIAAIRSYAALLSGNIEWGYAQAQKALELLPKDDLTVRSVVAFVMGGVNIMRQDIPGAIEAMQKAGEIGERAGNIHLAVSALSSAGSLMIGQGKLSEAERVYERALKLATGKSGQPLPIAANVFSGLAQLYLAQNDLAKAGDAAEHGVELAGQWGNVDSLAGNYLSLAYVHRMEGNETETQQALAEVKRIAATHTLSPGFEERLAAFASQAKTQPPGSPPQGLLIEPLTERELEVLRLMAEGRSNAEIAAELIIALGTVKAHTSSIYRKLDVRSRTEAVVKASELGLL